jgi:hypothetical protein
MVPVMIGIPVERIIKVGEFDVPVVCDGPSSSSAGSAVLATATTNCLMSPSWLGRRRTSAAMAQLSQQHLQCMKQSRIRSGKALGKAHEVGGLASVAQPAPQCLVRDIGPHGMT